MRKDKKDLVMIVTALVTLASGIIMSFLSFILTVNHEIHNSVLWYFAQTLMYAASTFGLYSYVKGKVVELENRNGHLS